MPSDPATPSPDSGKQRPTPMVIHTTTPRRETPFAARLRKAVDDEQAQKIGPFGRLRASRQ